MGWGLLFVLWICSFVCLFFLGILSTPLAPWVPSPELSPDAQCLVPLFPIAFPSITLGSLQKELCFQPTQTQTVPTEVPRSKR